ncbi:MAG: hypothetical protein SFV15_16230 [Polyangiaceae bacterium]|nr:hypothetical protein [Polyangiaceae bacterium]
MKPWVIACAILGGLCLEPALGFAQGEEQVGAVPSGSLPSERSQREGRPRVHLSRLTFPQDLPDAAALERHLRHTLARAARRVDWGAGQGHKIEYRFTVEELRIEKSDGLVRVSCRATGQLPKGKRAKSAISFGGDPKTRDALVHKVLGIVAQGVIARLAELERARRGQD